jgi:AcrR family transcriptional regulator
MQDTNIRIPQTRNALGTFNMILDAALEMFYQSGYHGTTIKDITQKAGVAAGTFYLYFPSKLALYKHILITLSHNIRKEIASKVALKKTRLEKEREGIKAFIEYVQENPEMYNVIWESLYIDRSLFKDYYESFAARYARGLNAAVEAQEIEPLNTEVIAYVMMGITNFIGLKVLLNLGSNNEDVDAIIDTVMVLLQSGLIKK